MVSSRIYYIDIGFIFICHVEHGTCEKPVSYVKTNTSSSISTLTLHRFRFAYKQCESAPERRRIAVMVRKSLLMSKRVGFKAFRIQKLGVHTNLLSTLAKKLQ